MSVDKQEPNKPLPNRDTSQPMNILFLTDNYPPESNAPASRTHEHARQWVADGHSVTVITCAPNFPAGKLYEGYKNSWYTREVNDGVTVVRVKTYITANEGFLKRTLDYQSFMLTGTLAAMRQSKPDVVVATSPQFFTAVAGYLVGLFRRVPFVFELRDLWPASITAVGAMQSGRVIRTLERLEIFLYRKAALIVPVTHTFKEELVSKGIKASKIVVVRNGVNLEQYRPMPKNTSVLDELDAHDAFIVGYIGTHGMAHGLPRVVEAAALLESTREVVFIFVGGGAERVALEADVKSRKLNNVRLLPMQPKARMPDIWSVCDIALIPLRNKPLFSSVIPSKLFECMGMGIPVIMSVPAGEATSIVEKTRCGLVVQPEDAQELADTVRKLRDDKPLLHKLKTNALKAAEDFSRKQAARNMIEAFSELQKK